MEEFKVDTHYGEILKSEAKKLGVSTSVMAKRLDMTEPGVYNIYRTKSPRIDVIIKFQNALGIGMDRISEIFGEQLKKRTNKERVFFSGKISDQSNELVEKICENREFYLSHLKRLEERMISFEKSLEMTNEIIKAKDQLISELQKQIKSAS